MPPRIEHRIIDNTEYKICKGVLCKKQSSEGIWKILSDFGNDSKSWDQLRSMCKLCKNGAQKINETGKSVKELVKEPDELVKPIGRPTEMDSLDIEVMLLDYDLYVLDDIEEISQMSKVYIHYACSFGHESTTRLDVIKSNIENFKINKRNAVCNDCNEECKEIKFLMDNENLVEEKGFVLNKMYKNERNNIFYDIMCKNNHLTTGRIKSSFLRSFSCKECKHNADEYMCSSCQQLLHIDKFNKCETNIHRNKTDHHCKDCREKQRNKRKDNGYKLPSRETVVENGIEGKICVTKNCGFHNYNNYWKDTWNADGYDTHCKTCSKTMNDNYAKNNQEKIKVTTKEYRKNNKERITSGRKKWISNNIEKYRKSSRDYHKKRRETDPNFKLLGNLRHRLNMALKNESKVTSTICLLGCSINELWIHLESLFQDGMTKENYGPIWHIDHIIPCDAFNLSIEQEQRRCFNWKNLQPMFAIENIIKGAKYEFDIVKEIELCANLT
jgi:hypothetical protein